MGGGYSLTEEEPRLKAPIVDGPKRAKVAAAFALWAIADVESALGRFPGYNAFAFNTGWDEFYANRKLPLRHVVVRAEERIHGHACLPFPSSRAGDYRGIAKLTAIFSFSRGPSLRSSRRRG